MTNYIYIKSEPGLFTVGFYSPSGEWFAESDHADEAEAVKQVHYLNGGTPEPVIRAPLRLIPMEDALPMIKGLLQPDTGRIFGTLAGVDMRLIENLNAKFQGCDHIGLEDVRRAICEVQGETVNIATNEYDMLIGHIRRGLANPANKAALALAKVALSTLEAYSPTTIAKAEQEDLVK